MLIEKDARRFIFKAIQYDKNMKLIETEEKLKGNLIIKNEQYNIYRKN